MGRDSSELRQDIQALVWGKEETNGERRRKENGT